MMDVVDEFKMLEISLPALYPGYLLRLVERRGITSDQLLLNTSLSPDILHLPNVRIFAWQYLVILDNLQRVVNDPTIAIELGLESSLAKAGSLSLGIMSCATLGDAIKLICRFIPLQCPFFALSLRVQEGMALVTVSEVNPLHRFRRFMIENFLIEITEILACLFIEQYRAMDLYFDCPEPEYFAPYKVQLPRLAFDQPFNHFRFPAEMLDLAIPTSNPALMQLIINHAEAELAQLGFVELWVDSVRALLVCRDRRYPTLPEVARQLHVSDRTLKRKLADQGLKFSDLLDSVRLKNAKNLLDHSTLQVEEIALNLGYQNSANFSKAFRRWSGLTPSEYRKRPRIKTPGVDAPAEH